MRGVYDIVPNTTDVLASAQPADVRSLGQRTTSPASLCCTTREVA
jgi:hypothetical protein